jgi:hypothetical protein
LGDPLPEGVGVFPLNFSLKNLNSILIFSLILEQY